MLHGLVVPDLESGTLELKLSAPLGRTVRNMSAELDLPPNAIENWRAQCREKIEGAVRRKIEALLMGDADYPEDDEALQRWARHGGRLPISTAQGRENARKFVAGIREAAKDDPEIWNDFMAAVERIEARDNGDDQKA